MLLRNEYKLLEDLPSSIIYLMLGIRRYTEMLFEVLQFSF